MSDPFSNPAYPPQGNPGYPAQGGFAPPQGYPGYPADGQPQLGWGACPPQQPGYPPQAGFPPQQTGYPPQQPGYPPQQAGFPAQQPGYPPQQQGFPPQQPGYPPQQPGCPPQQAGYPPQQQGYPAPQGGYPPQQGYAAQEGGYPAQPGQGEGYPSQGQGGAQPGQGGGILGQAQAAMAGVMGGMGQPKGILGQAQSAMAGVFGGLGPKQAQPTAGPPQSFPGAQSQSGLAVDLHGELHIKIIRAENLPNLDTSFLSFKKKDVSDPFVTVSLGGAGLVKSKVIDDDLNPVWDESFCIPVCHNGDSVKFTIKDKDITGHANIGSVSIRTHDLLAQQPISGWFDLQGNKSKNGKLNLEIQYFAKNRLSAGIEVPDTYFGLRQNCNVRLYQDAHCPALPVFSSIPSHTGGPYIPGCAWRDVYHDIENAKEFIYITGWSVYTEIALLRDGENDDITLGDLLSEKADQGVKILMLVWDEKMSTGISLGGMMGTHDEETRQYFSDVSNAKVVLVGRGKKSTKATSLLTDQFRQTCYTHHQKTIILDSHREDGQKEIVAYVGGLDLAAGRYDTPEHETFKTLRGVHNRDFMNKCASVSDEEGPREPWHDIHCRVQGQVALDVLGNFVERWRRQASKHEKSLYNIDFNAFNPNPYVNPREAWSVQLFRSINEDSAMFDTNLMFKLINRKGKRIDDSIHRCYIHQIRRARDFLYIENQYFLGSAHMWDGENETKAHHIVPVEIAEKIVEKIHAGQHFVAYIVVPMFPEGDPTSQAVQEILHWQHNTMQMMYKLIAAAINKKGLQGQVHPTDFLAFYCLGKKVSHGSIPNDLNQPKPSSVARTLRDSARHMIYVHSKMMIVDDEYVIIGSANINQRSMAGNRDSEIAVGAHQPAFAGASNTVGSVHEFRKGLWAEHIGHMEPEFAAPGRIECVRKVNQLADHSMRRFLQAQPEDLQQHLLKYPVEVRDDGSVTSLPGCETFPDTTAKVLGARTMLANTAGNLTT